MAETFTVTKAKYAGEKDNPHGGKLHKFYCSFVDSATNQEFHDVYWQRKDENRPEGEFFGRIEKGEFGLRFYTEQKQNGSQPRSGGSSGAKDEYWQAKEQRDIESQARMGRAHAQEMALRWVAMPLDRREPMAAADVAVLEAKGLTAVIDWFHADVQRFPVDADGGGGTAQARHVPSREEQSHATGSSDPAAVSAPTGFASDKQKAFFERLLKQASLDSNQVAGVVRFTEQLPTERVSKAIDGLNDNDSELAERTVAALLREADAWARLQSDVPFDEAA